jgi:hypothetical protein
MYCLFQFAIVRIQHMNKVARIITQLKLKHDHIIFKRMSGRSRGMIKRVRMIMNRSNTLQLQLYKVTQRYKHIKTCTYMHTTQKKLENKCNYKGEMKRKQCAVKCEKYGKLEHVNDREIQVDDGADVHERGLLQGPRGNAGSQLDCAGSGGDDRCSRLGKRYTGCGSCHDTR